MPGRALWFIPTARRIPAVWDWINRTDYVDKLIVRNFQKDTADEIAMQFFFKRPEYDYFIISTDDVVGNPYQVRALLEAEEEHEFPIIGGWCNHIYQLASLTTYPIDPEVLSSALEKPFPGLSVQDYKMPLLRDVVQGVYGFPFMKVWFYGIPLTLVRREILERIPFRDFRLLKDKYCVTPDAVERGRGVMQDLQWAIDCAERNIPITVDVRVFLLHVFGTRGNLDVGMKPSVGFTPAKGEEPPQEEIDEIQALIEAVVESAWEERKLTEKRLN